MSPLEALLQGRVALDELLRRLLAHHERHEQLPDPVALEVELEVEARPPASVERLEPAVPERPDRPVEHAKRVAPRRVVLGQLARHGLVALPDASRQRDPRASADRAAFLPFGTNDCLLPFAEAGRIGDVGEDVLRRPRDLDAVRERCHGASLSRPPDHCAFRAIRKAGAPGRLAEAELACAGRPGVPALVGENPVADEDLLHRPCLPGRRREAPQSVVPPRPRVELQAAVVRALVERPVAAGLALRQSHPDAVGTRRRACGRAAPGASTASRSRRARRRSRGSCSRCCPGAASARPPCGRCSPASEGC